MVNLVKLYIFELIPQEEEEDNLINENNHDFVKFTFSSCTIHKIDQSSC